MQLNKDQVHYILDEYQEKFVNWYNDNIFNKEQEAIYNQTEETVSKWYSEPSISSLEALKLKFNEIYHQIKKHFNNDEMLVSDDSLNRLLKSMEV